MSRYRILEKKGRQSICQECIKQFRHTVYIPRFIVQECIRTYYNAPLGIQCSSSYSDEYRDLKEFTSLEEAREYKRDLELEEGIVRE